MRPFGFSLGFAQVSSSMAILLSDGWKRFSTNVTSYFRTVTVIYVDVHLQPVFIRILVNFTTMRAWWMGYNHFPSLRYRLPSPHFLLWAMLGLRFCPIQLAMIFYQVYFYINENHKLIIHRHPSMNKIISLNEKS